MAVTIVQGDARHLELPDESVDLVITSPPYWGLRSYTDDGQHYGGQIGSEPDPAAYLEALWECTAEWARVLKPSGSMFVNLGDKYTNRSGTGWGREAVWERRGRTELIGHRAPYRRPDTARGLGLPEKALLGLPWRYALGCTIAGSALASAEVVKLLLRDVALGVITLAEAERTADELAATPGQCLGLILRAEIIWHKLNGLPESVTDRVRRGHEQIFHLVKQPAYYSAVDVIREQHQPQSIARSRRNRFAPDLTQARVGTPNTLSPADACNPLGKLPGSVWDIPTQPLAVPAGLGADHFAAFPMELPRRLIKGWSPPAICLACGDGRRPVMVKRADGRTRDSAGDGGRGRRGLPGYQDISRTPWREGITAALAGYACACTPHTDHPGEDGAPPWREYHTAGWEPPPSRPAVVVDPFGGTGTTALVADVLGRDAYSYDLSGDYCRIARWRTADPAERARALQVPPPKTPAGDDGALFVRDEA